MPATPKLTTICADCEREDVGVVLDWTHRDANNQLIGRYRLARHKVKYQSKDRSVPWCINSRSLVPEELVFETEKV